MPETATKIRVVPAQRTVEGGGFVVHRPFPVPGLSLASTAHVYPEIVSGQAVSGVSERVVPGILERLPAEQKEAA